MGRLNVVAVRVQHVGGVVAWPPLARGAVRRSARRQRGLVELVDGLARCGFEAEMYWTSGRLVVLLPELRRLRPDIEKPVAAFLGDDEGAVRMALDDGEVERRERGGVERLGLGGVADDETEMTENDLCLARYAAAAPRRPWMETRGPRRPGELRSRLSVVARDRGVTN